MAKSKRMLRLTFIDDQGVPYHEAVLSPRDARESLKRSGIHTVRISGTECQLHCVTYAEVQRSSRGIVARPGRWTPKGLLAEVLIVLADD